MMSKPLALIIDDDVDVAGFFAFALQDAGYETRMAHDGKQATAALQSMDPHLVVMDMYLPDTSGADLLREFYRREESRHSWVIAATGVGKALEGWVEETVDFTLIKPVDYRQVYTLVLRLRDLSK